MPAATPHPGAGPSAPVPAAIPLAGTGPSAPVPPAAVPLARAGSSAPGPPVAVAVAGAGRSAGLPYVAVLLAGAGSSAGFLRRAFEGPLAAAGYALVPVEPEPGPGVVEAGLAALDRAAAEYGPRLRLVGGVSLGAHLALRWTAAHPPIGTPVPTSHGTTPTDHADPAAGRSGGTPTETATADHGDPAAGENHPADSPDRSDPAAHRNRPVDRADRGDPAAGGSGTGGGVPGGGGAAGLGAPGVGGSGGGLDGVLVAMPAWTGVPGAVAAATGASADLVERLGTAGALARVGDAVPWVAAELAAAWPAYGDLLAPSLRAAAAAPGPSPAELAAVGVPVGLVACTDDPLHPYAVAEEWAAALPRAALHPLRLADLAEDRAVLGTAALRALTEAATT